MIGILAAVGVMVVLVIIVLPNRSLAWILWIPAGFVVLQAIPGVIISVIAARPYRAERRLGYTTWPSERELKS